MKMKKLFAMIMALTMLLFSNTQIFAKNEMVVSTSSNPDILAQEVDKYVEDHLEELFENAARSRSCEKTFATVIDDEGNSEKVEAYVIDTTNVVENNTDVKFQTVVARSYYEEKKEEDEENNKMLPPIEKKDVLKLKELAGNQHFTQPPARYSEASLIKTMEENGIGRPSTYAPTITTIISRLYVEREGKQLKPTALGEVTTDLMKDHFKHIVDAKFTAKMENDLDAVERGETDWVDTLDAFYQDFEKVLEKAEKSMEGKRVKVPDEETDIVCDQCGRNMVIKIGRFGKFLACPGFPECKNTKKIVQETKGTCPLCGQKIILKKSKKGRSFYGCENYPNCNFMTWNMPVEDKCPKCGNTLFKKGGKSGKLICEKPDCGYEKDLT